MRYARMSCSFVEPNFYCVYLSQGVRTATLTASTPTVLAKLLAEDYLRFIDQDLRSVDQVDYDEDGRPSPTSFKRSLENRDAQPTVMPTVLKAASRFKKTLKAEVDPEP